MPHNVQGFAKFGHSMYPLLHVVLSFNDDCLFNLAHPPKFCKAFCYAQVRLDLQDFRFSKQSWSNLSLSTPGLQSSGLSKKCQVDFECPRFANQKMLRSGERNVKSLQPGTMLLPFGPPDHSTFLFRMPRENHHQDPVIFWRSSRLYPLTLWLQTANFAKNRCRPCDWKRELSSTRSPAIFKIPGL